MKTIKKLLFLSILTASLASVFTLSTPALADGGWGGHGWGHGGGWAVAGLIRPIVTGVINSA